MSTQEADSDPIEPRITDEHQPDNQIWVRFREIASTDAIEDHYVSVSTSGTRIMVDVYNEDDEMVDSAFYKLEELTGEALAALGYDIDIEDVEE